MLEKFLVAYLISVYDDKENLVKFIQNYNKYKPGCTHDLLICFKNFNKDDEIFQIKELSDIKFIKFEDNNKNDYDWWSYRRIAEKFEDRIIMFMNCHSYPVVDNWLGLFSNNYEMNSLVGPGASFESAVNFSFNKNLGISYFKSILYALSNLIDFPIFPNAHIRSSSFMISARDYQTIELSKKYKYKKKGTWINESGRRSMTNQLKKKKFKIFVINSDGSKFKQSSWALSNTYALGSQSKLIISDKHSRLYDKSTENEKKIISKRVWGN